MIKVSTTHTKIKGDTPTLEAEFVALITVMHKIFKDCGLDDEKAKERIKEDVEMAFASIDGTLAEYAIHRLARTIKKMGEEKNDDLQ